MKLKTRLLGCAVITLLGFLPAVTAEGAGVDTLVPTLTWSPTCANQTQLTSSIVCQTDNETVVYYMQGSLTSGSKTSVRTTQNNSYDGTDLNVSETSSPVYSGSGETDIVYQQGESGFTGTQIGIYWCDDAVDGEIYECDQGYVKVRYTASRYLACHETGHAVGLVHGAQAYPSQSQQASIMGCMVTPANDAQMYLGDTNVQNINGVYPQ